MEAPFYPCNQPSLDEKFTVGRFKDRVVAVAGGASGIGFACVHRFVNDGASVAILDYNREMSQSAIAHIQEEGLAGKVKCYFVDVVKKESCDAVAKAIAEDNGGKIHHVVNAVAYFGSKGVQAEHEDWRKSFDVNVIGYSNVVQACLPYMSPGCTVVNLSSASGKRAQPVRWTYSATKAAIIMLTKCMALDLGKQGIRVNTVTPSWVWSPEQAKAAADGQRALHVTEKFHILQRDAETSEVAAVVVFLSSRDASFVTGADYAVDGGYTAMGPEQHGDDSLFAGTDYKA